MYARKDDTLDESFGHEVPSKDFNSLTSLQLCDFRGNDVYHVGSLGSIIHAPRLKVLEMLRSDWENSTELIRSLPRVSKANIEVVVLDLARVRRPMPTLNQVLDFFSSKNQPLSLPSIKTLVILPDRDWTGSQVRIDLESAELFFRERQGILKNLVLPHYLDSGIEEQRWSTIIAGVEISYRWEINNHGFSKLD
ncbi:hypothetical protein DL93DRAFT_2083673 [Clavulina sp. PMI_390]|nr:hypothetical protein DL93DRAFT_2083673 [Clavulina sp. PMI_390]